MDPNTYFIQFPKGKKKRPTLKAMDFFMDEYNHIDENMNIIHIAGTNGKGSTVKIISNILIKAGYSVGTFVSPHLTKYNERISINNQSITDKEMSDLIDEIQPKIDQYNEFADINELNHMTWFEALTIIAFLYFYRNNVDFVVIETGLGGLFDSTNFIKKSIASVITSIGYDHMKLLGSTLEEIAFQKAGIIKRDSETLMFDQSPSVNKVFIDKCNEENNKLHIFNEDLIKDYSFDEEYQYFSYKSYKNLKTNLKGKIQINNSILAIETMEIVKKKGFKVSKKSIREGLSTVVNHGRMETLYSNPTIIYDGAHNIPAFENLLKMVNMYYPNCNKTYIISILTRKKYDTMLEILSADQNAKFILTSGNNEDEFTPKETLYDCAKHFIPEEKIEKMDLEDALKKVIKEEQLAFVIGSFHTYGRVRDILEKI